MYCTLDDIIDHIPEENIIQLTDDEGFGTVHQSRLEKAITTASGIIDGYLRGRYSIPLSPVPELIKEIAVDVAIYKLYERRLETNMPETMTNRYKNAIRLLEHIQKGIVKLGIESPETGPGQGHYKTNKSDSDRIFDRTNLDKF